MLCVSDVWGDQVNNLACKIGKEVSQYTLIISQDGFCSDPTLVTLALLCTHVT